MPHRTSLFPVLCAAMIAGILLCAGMILYMLISRQPIRAGAQFVRETTAYAHV